MAQPPPADPLAQAVAGIRDQLQTMGKRLAHIEQPRPNPPDRGRVDEEVRKVQRKRDYEPHHKFNAHHAKAVAITAPVTSKWRLPREYPRNQSEDKTIYLDCRLNYSGHNQGIKGYHKWIKAMEDWFYFHHVPKCQKVQYAEKTLQGEASRCWRREVKMKAYYHKPEHNWISMKMLMYKEFVLNTTSQEQCKSFKPLKNSEIYLTGNHDEHKAKKSSTKRVMTPPLVNQNVENTMLENTLARTSYTPSISCIMHLSLPKVNDVGFASKERHEEVSTKEEDQGTIKDTTAKEIEKDVGTNEDSNSTINAPQISKELQRLQDYEQRLTPNKSPVTEDEIANNVLQIKEKPPDDLPIDQNRGKLLHPFTLQWTNLKYLCAGDQVLRTKLFEERGNDAVIKPRTINGKDTERLSQVDGQNSTQAMSRQASSTSERTPEHYSAITDAHINWENSAPIFGVLLTHLESLSKWNHSIRSLGEGVMNFTSQTYSSNPESDLQALFGVQRSNQKDSGYKPKCFGIQAHQGRHEIWNHLKRISYEKLMEFTRQGILHMLYLEADEFGRFQRHDWRHEDLLQTLRDLKRVKYFPFDPGIRMGKDAHKSCTLLSFDRFLSASNGFSGKVLTRQYLVGASK